MIVLSPTWYLWIKALHIIAVITWMAGIFYLPRLFVYHAGVPVGSEQSELFKVMERRLYKAIMVPSMVVSVALGLVLLANLSEAQWAQGWVHLKITAAVGMLVVHWFDARWRRAFEQDANRHSARFYRFANEAPTLLMLVIVIMAVVKPF